MTGRVRCPFCDRLRCQGYGEECELAARRREAKLGSPADIEGSLGRGQSSGEQSSSAGAPFAYALPEYERAVMSGRLVLAHPGCLDLLSSEGAAEPLTREQVAARFPVTDDRCCGCGGKLDGPPVSLGITLDADEAFVKPMGAA